MAHHRRQFLQASFAAGAGLGLGATGLSGAANPSPTPAAAAGFTNPAVRPGRVRWHASFAAACAAAERSRKPVFLLQLLGRLDQRFC
jgi:hypothetical protein